MYDKVLYGVAGAAGASVVAWRTMFPWIHHDLKVMNVGRRLKSAIEQDALSGQLLVEKFEEHVARQPKKPMIIFEGNVFTYEYVDQQANKVANIVKSWGLKVGETVAMMIFNEPAFVWTFLGLQKLGLAAALINFNLRQIQLSHSVNVSDAKAFIVGAGEELFHAVLEEEGKFGSMPIYFQGCVTKDLPVGYHSFDDLMATASTAGLDPCVREGVTMNTTACFIYTSGTTGLPKPVYVSQGRIATATYFLPIVSQSAKAVVYTTLPLYHSSGGGIGMMGVCGIGLSKPVFISQKKMIGIAYCLLVVSLSAEDVVYTTLPFYHTSGGGIGMMGVIAIGLPKPAYIRQATASSMSRGVLKLVVDFNKDDVSYMVLPLYHSAGGGLGHFGVIRAGLSKPVFMSQKKMIGFPCCLRVVSLSAEDVVYTTLPLYHSSGGGIGMMGVIAIGATMVLRRKFSASHFWEDCCRHKVTVIQYIGELFRYLLSRPKSPAEKNHCIRAAFGNGLRKDIWLQVKERFNIPLIAEFFGATEGTTMLFNISHKPGAVGRVSPLLQKLSPNPMALVKYDFVTAEPIRDKNGRCIQIKPGEKGLFLSGIPQEFIEAGHTFYKASEAANEKKIVRNAFTDGDMFFNFGDLLYLDKEYFVYFSDRIGDTFRWKGENVSTTEVANILTGLDFVHDANVYGVTVPGHDGRAGMVSLTLHDDKPLSQEFLQRIWSHCEEYLASYARPLFLRLLKEAIQTATFKQQKVQLVQEGFDPSKVSDPMYYADPKTRSFIPITDSVYAKIVTTSKL